MLNSPLHQHITKTPELLLMFSHRLQNDIYNTYGSNVRYYQVKLDAKNTFWSRLEKCLMLSPIDCLEAELAMTLRLRIRPLSTPLTFGGLALPHQESPPPVLQTQQQPLRVSTSDFAKVPPGEVERENTGHTGQGWCGGKQVHVGGRMREDESEGEFLVVSENSVKLLSLHSRCNAC